MISLGRCPFFKEDHDWGEGGSDIVCHAVSRFFYAPLGEARVMLKIGGRDVIMRTMLG